MSPNLTDDWYEQELREYGELWEARAALLREQLDRVIGAGVLKWYTVANTEPAVHEWLGLTLDEYEGWAERNQQLIKEFLS